MTLPPVRIAVTVKGLSILSGPMPRGGQRLLDVVEAEAFLTMASVTVRSMLPSCRLNTSMSPTLYLRLSAARLRLRRADERNRSLEPENQRRPRAPEDQIAT